MRLLNVRTLQLESFFDNTPPYAILSHCWEDGEVLYSDISSLEKARAKKGFMKIQKTCERAIEDDLDYCWVDTCCIDKRSSAELSEAINSMFGWYKESKKCYAYLADVKGPGDFAQSKWFSRAWTLQELLAPSVVTNKKETEDPNRDYRKQPEKVSGMDFYTGSWTRLGSKDSLSAEVSRITGVPKEYLQGKSLNLASISMRMSWAADREATRAEDVAYSLLGIFDVNLPLLYGEGKLKAFRRLQEEIMRISEDETLLSWETTEVAPNTASADVLASDPKDFIEARNLIPFTSDEPIAPYSMTHRGLRIWLQLFHLHDSTPGTPNDIRQWMRPIRAPIMIFSSSDNLVWSPLRCHVAHDFHNLVMVPLRHVSADMYIRDTSTNVALVPTVKLTFQPSYQEVFIRNSRISSISDSVQRQFGILIRHLPSEFTITSVVPSEAWDPRSRILQVSKDASGRRSWNASLQLSLSGALTRAKTSMFLSLGCKQKGKEDPMPWCFIDDFVYTSDNIYLASFHDSVFSSQPRHEVTNPKDCDGVAYGFGLRVKMFIDRIFGQRMFVVDIERRGSENGNVKSEPVPTIPTIKIEARLEYNTQHGTEPPFVNSRRRSISSRPTDQ